MSAFGEQAAIALRAVELHGGRSQLVQQADSDKAALAAENARLSALEQECREQVRLLTSFKTGLTYSVSHEVRTSLAAMKAATELLLEGNVESGTEKFSRLLQSIARNVTRQEALVSNILDIASLENAAVSLNLERLDVASLVADATGLVIPLMNQRGQALSLSVAAGLPPLMADRQRVSQVLVNLLSNANKYAPAGSEVVLSVEARDGQMVFTVADSGPGVPAEERERIFEPFYRVRRGSDIGAPGTGLGLAIARSLIELHRGSIWVEDSPTGGAAFIFTLRIEDE
jgi:signal transduction histidine kinase